MYISLKKLCASWLRSMSPLRWRWRRGLIAMVASLKYFFLLFQWLVLHSPSTLQKLYSISKNPMHPYMGIGGVAWWTPPNFWWWCWLRCQWGLSISCQRWCSLFKYSMHALHVSPLLMFLNPFSKQMVTWKPSKSFVSWFTFSKTSIPYFISQFTTC